MFDKILIPVEFGFDNISLLRVAVKLAVPRARVRLVHVLENDTTLFYARVLDLARFRDRAESELRALAASPIVDGPVRIETQLCEGKPAHEILQQVQEFEPGAVVLGSHGRRGLERFLLGSVAESVLHHVKLPVCIVKGGVLTDTLRSVVWATDLEDTGEPVLATFAALVKHASEGGRVVHALRSSYVSMLAYAPIAGDEVPVPVDPAVEDRLRAFEETAKANLDALVDRLRKEGCRVTPAMGLGEPWDVLEHELAEHPADLVVLGTRGLGRLGRSFLGSVADKLVRTIQTPLLVVPRRMVS